MRTIITLLLEITHIPKDFPSLKFPCFHGNKDTKFSLICGS